MRSFLSALLLTGSLLCSAAGLANDERGMTLGRQCADDFYQGRLDALWQRMTPDMRKAFGDQAGLVGFQQKVKADFGAETTVLHEHVMTQQGFQIYVRDSRFAVAPNAFSLRCVFDGSDKIAGFMIQPVKQTTVAPTAYLDYQTKAALRLPFDGAWYTFWGGRTPEQNYHVIARDQRFAYDFVVVRDGKSHHGEPTIKENYFCWDQKILAPAAGTVVVAKDGLIDNAPGEMDASNAAGNHVVLDLGNNEYALLAHLRQGSVKVKVGEPVQAGQELGRCGNSGNTSEPHLHFHLQNAARFGEGEGLPAFFNDYLADGKPVTRGEPLRGQTISPAK